MESQLCTKGRHIHSSEFVTFWGEKGEGIQDSSSKLTKCEVGGEGSKFLISWRSSNEKDNESYF